VKNNRILDGPIGKTLFAMTLPMIFGVLAIVAMNLTDTYFVARLGTKALAAMGFIFPVVFVVASFTTGLGAGVAAVISQAIGKGDSREVQRLTKHSLMLGLLLVGALVAVGMNTIDPLFRALGAGEDTLPLIRAYMEYWYPGMLFLIIPMIGNSAIRATGDTKIPSYIMINAAIINVVLDPLLIFGIGPFPEMGISGAALATIFARASSLLASIYVLHAKKNILDFSSFQLASIGNSWRRILFVGLPSAATQLLVPLGMLVFTRIVAEFGKEAVAAIGTAVRIEALAMVPVIALSATLMPFLGQNWGAKKHSRVIAGIRKSNLFALLLGGLVFIAFLAFARPIALLFTDDFAVINYLVFYLRIVSVAFGLQAVSMLIGTAFNATGQPLKATTLTFIRTIVLFVPLAWLGALVFGYEGLLIGAAGANMIAGIMAMLWQRKVLRKYSDPVSGIELESENAETVQGF
jgi:MATE family, multidrug efflux pump